MVTELENLTNKEMLMELNLFNLKDRRLRGNLVTLHQFLKYIYRDQGIHFRREHGDKTTGASCFRRNSLWI